MSTTKPIRRITLFKIPKAEDQEKLLEIYKTMPQDAQKVVSPRPSPYLSIIPAPN
jgi:hypothetical protein